MSDADSKEVALAPNERGGDVPLSWTLELEHVCFRPWWLTSTRPEPFN